MDTDYDDNFNYTYYINYTSPEWNMSDRNLHRIAWKLPPWFYILYFSICSLELFLIFPAIYRIWILSKTDHGGPVYIINLLISDIFQIFGQLLAHILALLQYLGILEISGSTLGIFGLIWFLLAIVSIGFMVCTAAERYIVIVHPIWYRTRRTKKYSVRVSILVWISPFFVLVLSGVVLVLSGRFENGILTLALLQLLPLPLLIFFVVQTGKALCFSQSVRLGEKRRIMAIQILVLCIYTLLYLPYTIGCVLAFFISPEYTYVYYINFYSLQLSPFFDVILYVFIAENIGKMWCFHCCKKMLWTQATRPKLLQ